MYFSRGDATLSNCGCSMKAWAERAGLSHRAKQMAAWAPAEIFPEGAKPPTLKKDDTFSARRTKSRLFSARCTENQLFFGAPQAQTTNVAFLRPFRLNYIVFITSAEGASEIFRILCRTAAYDVIFFKFRGGGKRPLLASTAGVHEWQPWSH